MKLQELINDTDFEKIVSKNSEKLVVINFYIKEDENSMKINEIFNKIANDSKDDEVIFVKAEMESLKDTTTKYSMGSEPFVGYYKFETLLHHFVNTDSSQIPSQINEIVEKVKKNSHDFSSFTRLREPEYTGFRRWIREAMYPFVRSGTQRVLNSQKGHYTKKSKFYSFVSITGTHTFLVAFFPVFFFGFGYHEIGRQIFVLLSSGVLLGNYIKDYLCLPRPLPPVIRLSNLHIKEFGMPSTHTVTAFNTPFYLIYKLCDHGSVNFWIACLLATIYTILVSYSRIYLGMHSLPDILSGILVAIVLLASWIFVGFDALEDWVKHGSFVPFWIILIAAVLCYLHPEPYDFCPCFEDSVCFTASAAGIVAGGARYPYQTYNIDRSVSMCLARYLLGTTILFSTRFVLKPILYRIVPPIFELINPPRRKFMERFKLGSSTIDPSKKLKVCPSIAKFKFDGNGNYDIDIPIKFIVYLAMGWTGSEWGPNLFWLLNMN